MAETNLKIIDSVMKAITEILLKELGSCTPAEILDVLDDALAYYVADELSNQSYMDFNIVIDSIVENLREKIGYLQDLPSLEEIDYH